MHAPFTLAAGTSVQIQFVAVAASKDGLHGIEDGGLTRSVRAYDGGVPFDL